MTTQRIFSRDNLQMHLGRGREVDRNEFELFGPPHPGEILREEVLPRLKLSRRQLAEMLGVSYSTASSLLSARRRLTPALAARLAAATGTNAVYWLVLQAHHDAWSLEHTDRAPQKTREMPANGNRALRRGRRYSVSSEATPSVAVREAAF
jgi:addiction module HigA family antidote